MTESFQMLDEDDFNQDSMCHPFWKTLCATFMQKTSKAIKVSELRWELHRPKKKIKAEKLPPTLGALIPHIQRANFVVRVNTG